MSSQRMACSITDGLQYDDWLEAEPEVDEDDEYERYKAFTQPLEEAKIPIDS